MRILIVDDEPNIRKTLRLTLESMNHVVEEAGTARDALKAIGRQPSDVALLDLRLGEDSGLDLVVPLREQAPRLAVIIITAHASIETAIEAMRSGAVDYLAKPFTPAQVRAVLERVSREQGLRDRMTSLEDQVREFVPEADLSGTDPQFQRVLEISRKVAVTEASVLIRGESGTGKGVLARTLHSWSTRSGGPFLTVSCPSLSAELLESELFGHVKGAFTGAIRDVAGKVASAAGGTLFLDEIGDLPTALQPKLLRFLQEKRYERVGETRTRTADVRLITATNRDLEQDVASGQFREDLLFRLNVVEVTLPPLRQRKDLPALADHLLVFFTQKKTRRNTKFSPQANDALRRYMWPGNLRELRNAIERAVILAEGQEIGLTDLPERIGLVGQPPSDEQIGGEITLEELEIAHVRQVLARSASLESAARTLGIDPSTLYRKRKQFGL